MATKATETTPTIPQDLFATMEKLRKADAALVAKMNLFRDHFKGKGKGDKSAARGALLESLNAFCDAVGVPGFKGE